MSKGNCDFTGTGGNYFPTIFFHLFILSLLTLGLYFPWAVVKVFRLKASHTTINEKPVRFVGTGGQLFILLLIQGLLTIITLGLYGPWALCKFFTWRSQNTIIGGRAGRFSGHGASLLIFYLIHLYILPLITLGLYSFYGLYRLVAWKEEHTQYGGQKTSFGGHFFDFIKILLISYILNPITLYLFLPWSIAMLYRWQINGLMVGREEEVTHFPQVKTNYLIVLIFLFIGLILLLSAGLCLNDRFAETGIPEQLFKRQQAASIRIKSQKPAPETTKTAVEPDKPKDGSIFITGKLGDRALALELKRINNLIALDNKNANAFYNRGWLYEYKGEIQKALEDYSRAINIDRRHADAYYNRGLIYIRQGKYELAVKDFTEVIKFRKRDADVYNNLGNAYVQMGKFTRALNNYNIAIRLKPDDPDLYYNRAIVYRSLRENKKSIQDFQRAADMGHKKAKEFLGQL